MTKAKDIARGLTPPYMWNLLKKCFPRPVPVEPASEQEEPLKGAFECPVCGKSVVRFVPLSLHYRKMGEKYPSVHKKNLAETLYVHAYRCPHCGESDRNRLYALYLRGKFAELKTTGRKYSFLDLAPRKRLREFLKSWDFLDYRSADLFMDDVDDKVDITDMHIYPDNRYDMILCSHVLEHVDNDRKAMAELYRILKPGGFAIVMVPINLFLEEDYEDSSVVTPEGRWSHFGQNDHVRVYSKKGFVGKLKDAGFSVHEYGEDYFGADVFEKNGIHPRSVLYVVTK